MFPGPYTGKLDIDILLNFSELCTVQYYSFIYDNSNFIQLSIFVAWFNLELGFFWDMYNSLDPDSKMIKFYSSLV